MPITDAPPEDSRETVADEDTFSNPSPKPALPGSAEFANFEDDIDMVTTLDPTGDAAIDSISTTVTLANSTADTRSTSSTNLSLAASLAQLGEASATRCCAS